MKKYGIPAALLAGGIALGAAFAPVGLASAQTEVPQSELTADDDGHPGRHGSLHGRAEAIQELLGLDRGELKAAFAEGQTLVEVAAAQGMSEEQLVEALVATVTEHIEEAVANDRIDQAKADERLAELEANISDRVNTVPSEREGRGGHRRGRLGFGEALTELGFEKEDVKAGFEEGQTLVEIAAAAGVSEEQLVSALLEEGQTHLNEAVADEKLTPAEADEKLEARITERVNTDPADRPGRPWRR